MSACYLCTPPPAHYRDVPKQICQTPPLRPALHMLRRFCVHFSLPFNHPSKMPRPSLRGSESLTLSESHLSVESIAPPLRNSRVGRPNDDASQPPESDDSSRGGETLIDEREELETVARVERDLEKGDALSEKRAKPALAGEPSKPTPLAADGTPVIVVDWAPDDPDFPKNW